ncbi:MAG: ArnT family glycosyltransferase [Alphaproteobacteria bacterium]
MKKMFNSEKKTANLSIAFILILIITSLRIYFLYNSGNNLYADEAQYWDWSRNLDWGYYSKPPFIAWIIRATTNIFGNSEFAIRLSSPILHAITSIIIYFISLNLFDRKIAFYSAITYLTLPSVTLSSSLISTDAILLFFWSLTILLFLKSINTNILLYWILTGLIGGCGCLAKYNMIIIVPSTMLYLIFTKQLKSTLTNYRFWACITIGFLVYCPNLYWNYNNGFVSYLHTQEISRLDKELFHPKQLFEFLAAQIIIIGPILTYILLISLKNIKSILSDEKYKFLISYFLPFLGFIALLSFISKALANWAAPAAVTMIIWIVAYQIRERKTTRILIVSIFLHLLVAGIFYNYYKIFDKDKLTAKSGSIIYRDPFYRMAGWREFGEKVKSIYYTHNEPNFLINDRKILVELQYYTKDSDIRFYKWNPAQKINNHYDLTRDIKNMKGENFIYLSKDRQDKITSYFKESKIIDEINITLYPDYKLHFYVYELQGFLGY